MEFKTVLKYVLKFLVRIIIFSFVFGLINKGDWLVVLVGGLVFACVGGLIEFVESLIKKRQAKKADSENKNQK